MNLSIIRKPVLPLLLLSVFSSLLTAARSPNFILIYTDDLGYADTSVQMMDGEPSSKHKFINTPGLERLADIGARFNAGYSPTPTCTGSRLSIQFGKSSAQMQYRNVFDVLSPIQRPDGYGDETTMAEMLEGCRDRTMSPRCLAKAVVRLSRADESGYDVTDENTPAGQRQRPWPFTGTQIPKNPFLRMTLSGSTPYGKIPSDSLTSMPANSRFS